jgi:hypothetical protein
MPRFLNYAAMAFLLVFAVSCKKETTSNPTSTDYYVKIKKDGAWITYTGSQTAGEIGPDGFDPANIDFGVSASSADAKERFDLTVQLVSNTFPAGTYHSSYLVDHPYVEIVYAYQPDITTAPAVYMIQPSAAMTLPAAYTVNVTEITATTLRGNFTGNYLATSTSDATVAITEGEFFVKRIR